MAQRSFRSVDALPAGARAAPAAIGLRYVRKPEVLARHRKLELLVGGAETFPAMLEAIAGARRQILFETYLLRDDRTGRRFQEALMERARAGVEVRVLYDSLASITLSSEFLEELGDTGVRTLEFNPIAPWRRRWSINRRDHRKTLVVDMETGFTGGINIGDEYAPPPEGGGWLDLHARVEGPAVLDLARGFRRAWLLAGGEPFPEQEPPIAAAGGASGALACAVDNFGIKSRWRMHRAYLHAIREAKISIDILNAYFIPDRALRRAFRRAVERGVAVRVIVPRHSDVKIVSYASRRLYARLLRGGVRIFEYPNRMMHAKAGVIDGVWSTIGSFNLDRRSIIHNLEVGMVILDDRFAARLQEQFERDLSEAVEILPVEWARRPLWQRALERVCYAFRYWL